MNTSAGDCGGGRRFLQKCVNYAGTWEFLLMMISLLPEKKGINENMGNSGIINRIT